MTEFGPVFKSVCINWVSISSGMKLEKIEGLGTRETGCTNEVSLSGVQLCILLGVGGVKTKHEPPTFDQANWLHLHVYGPGPWTLK